MRLFAAVVPPADVLDELAGVVGPVRRRTERGDVGGGGLRWAARDAWHLTVAFYGEMADGSVPELSARLARGAARTEPFRLALRGGGHFGGSVLWAGLGGDTAVLRRLAERARAAGRRVGAPGSEHRRYHPHLTLARAREDVSLAPYLTGLDDFTGASWTVDEIALFRSHPPAPGVPGAQPQYEQVGGWPLGREG